MSSRQLTAEKMAAEPRYVPPFLFSYVVDMPGSPPGGPYDTISTLNWGLAWREISGGSVT